MHPPAFLPFLILPIIRRRECCDRFLLVTKQTLYIQSCHEISEQDSDWLNLCSRWTNKIWQFDYPCILHWCWIRIVWQHNTFVAAKDYGIFQSATIADWFPAIATLSVISWHWNKASAREDCNPSAFSRHLHKVSQHCSTIISSLFYRYRLWRHRIWRSYIAFIFETHFIVWMICCYGILRYYA